MQRKQSLPRSREDIIAFIRIVNGGSIYLYIEQLASNHFSRDVRFQQSERNRGFDLSGNPAWIVVIRLEKRGGNSSKKGRSRYLSALIQIQSRRNRAKNLRI